MKYKAAAFFLLSLLASAPVFSASDSVDKSTPQPLGSPYYRHLAFDFNWDIEKLYRYEARGFGRGEIITLMLISKISGTPLKDLGNRRLNGKDTLEDMAVEAGLDYVTLYKTVQVIKDAVDAKGDQNLPPPVYPPVDKDKPSPTEDYLKKQKEIE